MLRPSVTVFFVTRSGSGTPSGGAGKTSAPQAQAGEAASASRRRPGEVALAAGVTAKNKIEVVAVRRTTLAGDINVIGNVSFSADHVAIVGPLVAGRIARLTAGIGAPYDPKLHERVGRKHVDGLEGLRVAEQIQRGYASQQPEFVLRRPKVLVTE